MERRLLLGDLGGLGGVVGGLGRVSFGRRLLVGALGGSSVDHRHMTQKNIKKSAEHRFFLGPMSVLMAESRQSLGRVSAESR